MRVSIAIHTGSGRFAVDRRSGLSVVIVNQLVDILSGEPILICMYDEQDPFDNSPRIAYLVDPSHLQWRYGYKPIDPTVPSIDDYVIYSKRGGRKTIVPLLLTVSGLQIPDAPSPFWNVVGDFEFDRDRPPVLFNKSPKSLFFAEAVEKNNDHPDELYVYADELGQVNSMIAHAIFGEVDQDAYIVTEVAKDVIRLKESEKPNEPC